jgi:hypothetical protein
VIGISLAVERLGPLVGGALVGLPIVVGPGFFFLIRDHPLGFSANAAASSLISLCATQAFLLVFCGTAARLSPSITIFVATGAWFGMAMAMSNMPPNPFLGLALFALAVFLARRYSRRFVTSVSRPPKPGGIPLLIVRGVAAGLLVAIATALANSVGPGWSGFIVTYPIGFTVISLTLHQRVGPSTAIATMYAAMLGVSSLAAFSFTLSWTIERFGPTFAFAAALVACLVVTSLLTWRSTVLAERTAG